MTPFLKKSMIGPLGRALENDYQYYNMSFDYIINKIIYLILIIIINLDNECLLDKDMDSFVEVRAYLELCILYCGEIKILIFYKL